jgi:hypothetical protein
MATLTEYYKHDFPDCFTTQTTLNIKTLNGEAKCDVIAAVHLNFVTNTKFISYFVPDIVDSFNLLFFLLQRIPETLKISDGLEISMPLSGRSSTYSYDLKFTGRVYFYYDGELNEEHIIALQSTMKENQLFLEFRDRKYVNLRNEKNIPLAFISHDNRDKEEIASKLASDLQKLMCPVWYDEYSLKIGDSLRETIEKGLKECKKCILILSPNYLSNTGWTKTEFNSIFTREILEKKNLILPVWCGITKEQIFDYSPTLADRVGIDWNKGHEYVAKKLYDSITSKEKF